MTLVWKSKLEKGCPLFLPFKFSLSPMWGTLLMREHGVYNTLLLKIIHVSSLHLRCTMRIYVTGFGESLKFTFNKYNAVHLAISTRLGPPVLVLKLV